ncbi:mitochondrial import receptor subunit TOM40 homolog 1 [Phymastichus coffea]|uniref:mitochondrial import receptor subunit TOM40 homolog 1 n=1 Tax=Phymastichus coffea TaxID=108790 RepID=UPI00273CBFCF|nr:mitochondrial import receptor subunit TOM40 homolog 1 [Phymastichus coffea]
MGNVQAATAPPPPPMGFQPPPPASVPKENALATPAESQALENPGTMEDLHKRCKEIFPVNFEGAKLILNKGLSSHFQISHTINMSSVMPSGYRFGATYVGTKQISTTETFPVLVGDIDPSGNLNANIIHQFSNRIRGKLATQVQRNKFTAVQMTGDYRGDTHSLSLTLGNPDIINNSGLAVFHYLQSITPKLALGGELIYQQGPGVPGGYISIISLAGRYIHGDSTISGSLGLAGCHICFHQKASQQVQVGVELEVNSRMQEAVGTIAYQVDLPKADLVFKGSVDSNWNVGAVLEKKLQPLPFTFALSGMINHPKNQFRLGCGLIIG